jgi:hypothetical protein
MKMTIRDFAEKYIKAETEAFNTGDFTALEKIESQDVVFHRGFQDDLVGFFAHKKDVISSRETTTDVVRDWQYLVGDGKLCAMNYKCSFKSLNEKSGVPAGKTMSIESIFVLRIQGGKLVEVWANGSSSIS